MKAFGLAVMLICLNYMCGIVTDLPVGLTSTGDNTIAGKIDYSYMESQVNINGTSTIGPDSGGFDAIKYVDFAFQLFANVIWKITFGFPSVLGSSPFNLPSEWVLLLAMVNIIIYTVGLIELARGVTFDWGG